MLKSTDEVWRILISETRALPEGENSYRGFCPVHEDSNESLYISKGEKGIVLYCHGCDRRGHEISYPLGVTKAELFYEQFRMDVAGVGGRGKKSRKPKGELVATFDYHDESGNVLFRVARYEDKDGKKDFRQQSLKGDKWVNNIRGVRQVLYRLPELLAADKNEFVYVAEGEGIVDKLRGLRLTATCNPGGAGKWKPEYDTFLVDRKLVILPDNDEPGESHAVTIASGNFKTAAEVRVLRLPGLPSKGDVVDWFAAGGTAEELQRLAAACELYDPEKEKPTVITNFAEAGDGKEPLTMDRILKDVNKATNGWPRRIGKTLFVPHETEGVYFVENESSLFEFISEPTPFPPKFARGSGLHPKREVFSALQRRAKSYRQIETFPHEPMIADHYYTCEQPEPGDGAKLDEFVGFFAPATDIDRDLIKLFIVTVFWGGIGGRRPLFVITSDAGRGTGKTVLVEMVGQLCGGVVGVSNNEKMEDIKKRLLSEEGALKRIVLMDNVKSSRFSWAELEAAVTAREISGWRLWKGDAARPNTITWAMTINGPSFGTDISHRALIIKINKPKYSASWTDKIEAFIEEYREEIVSDCVAFLRGPIYTPKGASRWNVWERAMLHRLRESDAIIEEIHRRQDAANVETEEGGAIEDHFRQKLTELGYSPDGEQIWIPSTVAAKWINESLGERKTVTACSRMLKQKITEGETESLGISKGKSYRGFIWSSPICSPDSPIDRDIEYRIEINRKGT